MTTPLAAPLAERVEYATAEWLALANAFLERQAPALAGLSATFSYARQFTDVPPHLIAAARHDGRVVDGDTLGFTLRFASSGVTVEPMFDTNADWRQVANYDAALPFAWLVRENNPGFARLTRELTLLCGARLEQPVVRTPMPDAVAEVLAALDDHMARRTINNPDIRHRAEQFGLASNLAELDDVGYTVLPNAFSSEYAAALREETHRNHAGRDDGGSFRATMLLARGRLWEEAAIHPWVLTVVEYLIGRGCLMYQSDTIVKTAGQETHPGLHSDYGASRITEPFPDYCVEGTCVWALDDFHREHGPTCILPGSFRQRAQVPAGTTQEGTRLIEMDAGSIAFWHGAVWHGSTPRSAPGHRTSLHNAYCRSFIRPLEGYQDIDPEIVRRNPPVFSTLCGLDDAFGKSGLEGADFERLGYAARQGYGSAETPRIQV